MLIPVVPSVGFFIYLITSSVIKYTVAAFDNEEYSCPPNTTGHCVAIPSNTSIRLSKSSTQELLTLTRVTDDGQGVVPVGRSYDAREWEAVAGPYDTLAFDCSVGNGLCQVNVPEATSANQGFRLSRFEHSLSVKDKIARFLEQVTFGTKRDELDDLEQINITNDNNLDKTFGSWVDKQIHEIAPTLHREFFRSRAAPRYSDRNPVSEGRMIHPCSSGARWRRFSITSPDLDKQLFITKASNRFALSIDGFLRTMVDNIEFKDNTVFQYTQPDSYRICAIRRSETFGAMGIRYNNKCKRLKFGIPPVDINGMNTQESVYIFDAIDPTSFITEVDYRDSTKIEYMISTTGDLFDNYSAICESMNLEYSIPLYVRLIDGQVLMYDPVLKLETNSLVTPLNDGGTLTSVSSGLKSKCINAPRTFLNDANCQLSSVAGCTSTDTVDLVLELNEENLKQLYQKTGRYYYAIEGLRLGEMEDANWGVELPCTKSARSRWVRMENDNCVENIRTKTANIFRSHWNDDSNPHMKDILFPGGEKCHQNDENKLEMILKKNGKCWKNIHPHELNVFDFTFWASVDEGSHPGISSTRNPITEFAEAGLHRLIFPAWHGMDRWYSNMGTTVSLLGRFGDSVAFIDLPEELKRDTSTIFGLFSNGYENFPGTSTVVCGSPGEVANNNLSVDAFDEIDRNDVGEPIMFDYEKYARQRKQVWTEVALKSPDQLRQRVAWALAQIFAISPDSLGKVFNTEMFLTYYDIFTRNAFGTYKDVLKEVAYSPLMAQMLTFYKSKSIEYVWNKLNELQFTDENFAREVMQLFTVGTKKLNIDGTVMLDSLGKSIPVYSNNDIIEYSRAWTGFDRQVLRGNIEEQEEYKNSIDPMRIQIEWRDRYPKMGLDGQYVGDQYMICADVPSQMFLRKGAQYRLLGNKKESQLQHPHRDSQGNIVVYVLDSSSELAAQLCQDTNGTCQFPSLVELDQNIDCFGVECGVEIVQIVQVHGIFYEYFKPACINFPFFNLGQTVLTKRSKDGSDTESACVDETLQSNSAYYIGHFTFTGDQCHILVVVDRDGNVAIEQENTINYTSMTYFRVHWQDDEFPHESNNNCGDLLCEIVQGRCRCRVGIEDEIKFTNPPSRKDVLSRLSIGAIPSDMMNYHSMITIDDEVNVYFKYQPNSYDKDTAFEVTDTFGRKRFLKNMVSFVRFRWPTDDTFSNKYSFRNPPVFYNATPELRNAQFETEAVLDHYIYHPNTAPFVSFRLLQRFGISNPSPVFLSCVSQAFFTGSYYHQSEPDSISFGSGKYGDLAATVAAIVLHPESRREVLDADPMYGSLREPLITVISMMRNLEYEHTRQMAGEGFVSLGSMESRIGQMAYEMPDIFSFFLPTYSAPGAISLATLNSPEATLLRKNVALLNGMISMMKFGLTTCYEGFGDEYMLCDSSQEEGEFDLSAGHLTFSPTLHGDSGWIVDEIATLLTSGRMSEDKRKFLRESYETEQDKEKALRHIQQLAVITPEFHTTGLVREKGSIRPLPKANEKTCKPYKAVVHLLLYGGMDSFNLLVPYSGCGSYGYNEYKAVRGAAKMKRTELLPINASGSSQACETYGIHHKMPVLKDLYDQGEASFIAGIGVMTELVTKDNYEDKTVTQLFAHDSMQAEIGRLDPFIESVGTGALGRVSDALTKNGFKVNGFGIDTNLVALEGVQKDAVKIAADSIVGFSKVFNPSTKLGDNLWAEMRNLNRESDVHNNIFSETVSASMIDSISEIDERYFAQLNGTDKMLNKEDSNNPIERKFQFVAKMIGSHDCRGADRDIFHMEHHRYDHHFNVHNALNLRFQQLNSALDSFITEMKNQDKWGDVTIVVTSDFGRTLTTNSNGGTDHGWSGHSFVMGGRVVGGKIFGDYPERLDSDGPLNVGRGRLIPTRPWESLWNPVSQWLGITETDDLNEVLPNRKNFPSQILLQVADMFHSSNSEMINCENEGTYISCNPDREFKETLSPSMTPDQPSQKPSQIPFMMPSEIPSNFPSDTPTEYPSQRPSELPSIIPSMSPSGQPSEQPSQEPSEFPSKSPSGLPSSTPTQYPSLQPSQIPSIMPSVVPSTMPSESPSDLPSDAPSEDPTQQPSEMPSDLPSSTPTKYPSPQPSQIPSTIPSKSPSEYPSQQPSVVPFTMPSESPSDLPSESPSDLPSGAPSKYPSQQPSEMPSTMPSESPSEYPSNQPSQIPSKMPSESPSEHPSQQPSEMPSMIPSESPSEQPSNQPSQIPSTMPSESPSDLPSESPSEYPSQQPSEMPSTMPSESPSDLPSDIPSKYPTQQPSEMPSMMPSESPSEQPSNQPSQEPSQLPSESPSKYPTQPPSEVPSMIPSESPSDSPSGTPSEYPTQQPFKQRSQVPSLIPSEYPSNLTSGTPSEHPTKQPSEVPSMMPSESPSDYPSQQPSKMPSMMPSESPFELPSNQPSQVPSQLPSDIPSEHPTKQPSVVPSMIPSKSPSDLPSGAPSEYPSQQPSEMPSMMPSESPSEQPSNQPSQIPSDLPSEPPSKYPSQQPSVVPSMIPSESPSDLPSEPPSEYPSQQPSEIPSMIPSESPSEYPSQQPSEVPSMMPSESPSDSPSGTPSEHPTQQPSEMPSTMPSESPSEQPSNQPSQEPSQLPSESPSDLPSGAPSEYPSQHPSEVPSEDPSGFPSEQFSEQPYQEPSQVPSMIHNDSPSNIPSDVPSEYLTQQPTQIISMTPNASPSKQPSIQPSEVPSMMPSGFSSQGSSMLPSVLPSEVPSKFTSNFPSQDSSLMPSEESSSYSIPNPSNIPSFQLSSNPSSLPSDLESTVPTTLPTTGAPIITPTEQASQVPTTLSTISLSLTPTDQPSILPTLISKNQPSSSPSILFCQDSNGVFQFKDEQKTCKFIGKGNIVKRCNTSISIIENCPVTCQTDCTCYNTEGEFNLNFTGKKRMADCDWVAQDVNRRCEMDKAYANCPITCGICYINT